MSNRRTVVCGSPSHLVGGPAFLGSDYVHRSGDQMAGPLKLFRDPAMDMEGATKRYVDGRVSEIVGGALASKIVVEPPVAGETNVQDALEALETADIDCGTY